MPKILSLVMVKKTFGDIGPGPFDYDGKACTKLDFEKAIDGMIKVNAVEISTGKLVHFQSGSEIDIATVKYPSLKPKDLFHWNGDVLVRTKNGAVKLLTAEHVDVPYSAKVGKVLRVTIGDE